MDPTEDLSARVLLTNILSTETPRTPITRSASKTQRSSTTRSSNRLSKKDAGAQTPQDILRRSLRHKLRESITRQSLPAPKRRTASVVLRKINTPATTSVLFDDADTPRHILGNILRTEPAKSPVVHEIAAPEEPEPSSDDSNTTRKRPSIELSGLDLPDLTIGNVVSTAKGLSRKRPRRSLNVTAFEKRLKDGEDVEEENEESTDDHSSLSLSSSTSLSLKTPFVDVRTEKKGLQRRVSNRRKITVEEFGAAVNKREMGGVSSFMQVERGLSETAHSEGFTLGLSKLSEPDITTDILHCNTALYAQPDAMTSSFSIVATQDKLTVMASQLQRQMEQEEQMEVEQSEPGKEKSMYAFPTEEGAEPQSEERFTDTDAAESQKEGEKSTAEHRVNERDVRGESEEEEDGVEAQTEEEDAADAHTEDDATARSQSDEAEAAAEPQTEEEEDAADSQTEGEQGGVDSQPEEDVAAMSQSEEEEVAADSQTEEEEGAVDSQTEEEEGGAVDSQTEEEEEGAVDSQSEEEEEGAVDNQSEQDIAENQSDQEDPAATSQSEEEGDLADSQPEDEHDGELEEEDGEQPPEQLEHISRRAQRSEGGLIVPVTEAEGDLADATETGWSDGKSKAHSSLGMGDHEGDQLHIEVPDLSESSTPRHTDASYTEAEPDADKEDSFKLPEVTPDIEDSGHLSDDSPEEAAAQDPAEQEEEEWEDEDDENGELPSKTPAFVKQKRNFLQADPQASPSVLKNIQASSSTGDASPAPKPKQVRQRRRGPAKKEAGLPKSYLMAVFKHFAKTKVSADVYPVLQDIMDKYFGRLAEDLETYAVHAKRKTIEAEDAELLLKRQGYVNDRVPVEVLIEKYLRMDQRKLLIPIATSGNVVIPKKR
ncbi:retinitis pigmentosa 1-like 1 protein isoform X1 [Epinephelus fuscoguttatus]|uniref:retinitis pigmentosa 1-like 1 protein isoform X1 n=1 Tax=Epinephelus fuscoguttatus TaxID=293821 RepID=UPI0020D07373|nr:retinitis pigmentosa 1-like 1 protein isoform X1 [Epinephelus fuscoguttatus]